MHSCYMQHISPAITVVGKRISATRIQQKLTSHTLSGYDYEGVHTHLNHTQSHGTERDGILQVQGFKKIKFEMSMFPAGLCKMKVQLRYV